MKPLLIIRTATSYDDLSTLCKKRGDEVNWFREACGLAVNEVIAVKVFDDAPLPDPDEVQAIIITGSVDMISDDLPWIERTAQWLKSAIEKQVPILGVCFGHQLLVHVLGGTVGQNPRGAEFGAVELVKSTAASDDPLFKGFPEIINMHVFHYESVLRLPDEVVLLASNDRDPHHAFRYGKNTWGVQFHPELDPEIMEHVFDVYGADMEEAGYDVAKLRERNVDSGHGRILLERFICEAYSCEV